MLSKEVFKEGIEELKTIFPELEMTKKRAELWYRYSEKLEDDQWKDKIANCIKYCAKRAPLLADILDKDGNYKNDYKSYRKV